MKKKTNHVWNFRRPNNLITPRQRIFLQKMITTAYAGKTSLQNQLLEKIKKFKVIEAHLAINKLLELKPMAVA